VMMRSPYQSHVYKILEIKDLFKIDMYIEILFIYSQTSFALVLDYAVQ
jgi:hypothetical protein